MDINVVFNTCFSLHTRNSCSPFWSSLKYKLDQVADLPTKVTVGEKSQLFSCRVGDFFKGDSSNARVRRAARFHSAGWGSKRRTGGSVDGSCTQRSAEITRLMEPELRPLDGAAERRHRCWSGSDVRRLWFTSWPPCVFALLLWIWGVKCAREEKRASFSPSAECACVPLCQL